MKLSNRILLGGFLFLVAIPVSIIIFLSVNRVETQDSQVKTNVSYRIGGESDCKTRHLMECVSV